MKMEFLSNSLVVLLLMTYGIFGIIFYFYCHSARVWDISESIVDYKKKTRQNRADWTVRLTWIQQNLTCVQNNPVLRNCVWATSIFLLLFFVGFVLLSNCGRTQNGLCDFAFRITDWAYIHIVVCCWYCAPLDLGPLRILMPIDNWRGNYQNNFKYIHLAFFWAELDA